MRSIFVTCLLSCFFQTTWTTADSNNNNNNNVVVVRRVNDSVTLDCDDTSGDHILWKKRVMPNYKVGDVIQQQNLQTFPIDASHVTLKKRHRHVENGILNLGPVEWSDGGQYSCHSWKQDRISLKSWTLIVLDSQQNISSKIFYEGIPLQNGTVLTAQEGESLTLTCLEISTEKSVFELSTPWSSGSSPIDSVQQVHTWPSEEPRQQQSHVVSRSLVIDSVERSDWPIHFECKSSKQETEVVIVDVNFPPTFTIRRVPAFGIPVVEGMRISLLCEVDKKKNTGDSDPQWLKDEKSIPTSTRISSGLLLIDRISLEDIGWYQCSLDYEGEVYTSIGYFLNVQSASFDNTASNEDRVANTVSDEDRASNRTLDDDSSTSMGSNFKEMSTKASMVQDFGKSLVAGRVSYEQRGSDEVQSMTDCDGCCLGLRTGLRDLQEKLEYYQYGGGGPRIRLIEQTEDLISVSICANPPTDKVFWITPHNQVVKPGAVTNDGYNASQIVTLNETCVTVTLSYKLSESVSLETEVTIIAKNRNGMNDFVVKLFEVSGHLSSVSAEISNSKRHAPSDVLLLSVTSMYTFVVLTLSKFCSI